MPIIASLPTVLLQSNPATVTTIPYPNVTASITHSKILSAQNGIPDVPKNVIIVSIVGGATLAFMTVVVYKMWEKWRKVGLPEKKSDTYTNTRERGKHPSRVSSRRERREKKVQFASLPRPNEKSEKRMTVADRAPDGTPKPCWSPSSTLAQTEYEEWPLPGSQPLHSPQYASRDIENASLSPSGSSTPTLVNMTPPPPVFAPRALRPAKGRTLHQKPTLSTLDSVSLYSTQSALERPPSWAATAWNRYSLMSRGSWTSDRGTVGNGRYYQISENSRNSPAPSIRTAGHDTDEMLIGIAY